LIYNQYIKSFGFSLIKGSKVCAIYGQIVDGILENQFTIDFREQDGRVESNEIKNILRKILEDCYLIIEEIKVKRNEISPDFKIIGKLETNLQAQIYRFFYDLTDSLYIPAGRTFSSSLTESMRNSLIKSISDASKDHVVGEFGDIDLLIMIEFLDYVSKLKERLKNKTFEYLIDRINSPLQLNVNTIQNAEKLATKILKGKYKNIDGFEYINVDDDLFISIENTSSGQQEVLRIVQEIFLSITIGRPCFRIIEEPEVHLFPNSQKSLVELFSILSNGTNTNNHEIKSSKSIITTHSPYILASFNNLMYAGKIGIENKKINPSLWIHQNQIRAYKLENGIAQDIIDYELGLIKNEEIDEASRIINEEFDFIDNLQ